MKRQLEVAPPTMPDTFSYKNDKVGKREDGFKPLPTHPITDFTEEEAKRFAEMMKQEFIKHWKKSVTNDTWKAC